MNDIKKTLRQIAIIAIFLIATLTSFSQLVYQNHFQTTYDFGQDEINFTLIQKFNNNYFCLPSIGNGPLGFAQFDLTQFEYDPNFLPINASRIVVTTNFFPDSIQSMIAYDLIQARDSSLLACGVVTFNGTPNKEGFILKLGYNGMGSWLKFYPPITELRSIIQTRDYNYALCGELQGNQDTSIYGVIIKINGNGNLLWDRIYWADRDVIRTPSTFNQITQSGDTLYAIGTTNKLYFNGNQADVMLVKLNQYNNPIRHVAYNKVSDSLVASSVELGKTLKFFNNRLWLAGDMLLSDTAVNDQDYFVMEVNKDNLFPLWEKRYDICSNYLNKSAEYVQKFLDTDTTITLAGYANNILFNNFNNNDNAFLVNMNSQGNYPYYTVFGGPADDRFYKPIKNVDQNIVATGYSHSFNTNNDIYTVEKYTNVVDTCHDSVIAKAGHVITFGPYRVRTDTVEVHVYNIDYKLSPLNIIMDTICAKVVVDTLPKKFYSLAHALANYTVAVNSTGLLDLPANTKEYYIISMTGAIVKQGKNMSSNAINISDLKPGIYILRLTSYTNDSLIIKFIK